MLPQAPSGFSNYRRSKKLLVGAVGIEPTTKHSKGSPLPISQSSPSSRVLRFAFLFRRSFPWARLRDNSCARQLPGFCFPGSSL